MPLYDSSADQQDPYHLPGVGPQSAGTGQGRLYDPSGDEQNPFQLPSVGPSAAPSVRDLTMDLGPVAVDLSDCPAVLYAVATEFVHAQVSVTDQATGDPFDPTAGDDPLIPQLAFTPAFAQGADAQPTEYSSGDRLPSDWTNGGWLTVTEDGSIWARLLVGPNAAVQLTPGRWVVWVKLAVGGLTLVGQAGRLIVR